MQNHTIEITINEEGEIESEVKGVLGPDCEGLSDWLEELGDTVEHHHTPDYRRQQRVGARVRVGGR
jgi:hypothetical protein